MITSAKQKGNITELECITYFSKLGYNVSIPFGENCRYDFILDVNNILVKIQCKTCRTSKDKSVLFFSCESNRNSGSNNRRIKYSCEDVDYFATFYNNVCYLVPSDECSTYKQLRLFPTKNMQKKGVNLAEKYVADVQINLLLKYNSLCT